MPHSPTTVTYATKSQFKIQENEILRDKAVLSDGVNVGDVFDFRIRNIDVKEKLEIDLETLVRGEAIDAYYKLRLPCVVEHAGLIFEDLEATGYPGGLTKPMWDSLGGRFIEETHSGGRRAIARAVVAYCDGKRVHTFTGDTRGNIADVARGDRDFYWDTVFIPDGYDLTYAEIVGEPSLGLEFKVLELSQSTKAMKEFLEWRRTNKPDLWF